MKTMKRFLLTTLCLLASIPALAANFRWVGKAQDIPQIDVVAFGGTWAASETASITCNDKTLTLTGGATLDTPAEYAAAFVEMVNSETHETDALTADMAITFGGYEFGEFRDMTASVDPSDSTKVLLTSSTAGVPFDVSIAEGSAAGTLALTSDGTGGSQLATGSKWFNAGDNWEGGSVPDGADTLIFDADAQVHYGLNNTVADLAMRVNRGIDVEIGLPVTDKKHNGYHYWQYRDRFLDLPLTATTGNVEHYFGSEGFGTSEGYAYIDLGTNDPAQIKVFVHDTPASDENGRALQIVGGAADLEVYVYKGSVSVGQHATENASVIKKLVTAYVSNQSADADVLIGSRASFANVTDTIRQSGGVTYLEADCAGSSNEIWVYGGKLVMQRTSSCDLLRIFGGSVDYRGDAHGQIVVYDGGVFDATNCIGTSSNDEIHLYAGFTYIDPLGAISETLNFHGCQPRDGTLNIRADRSATLGPITTAP